MKRIRAIIFFIILSAVPLLTIAQAYELSPAGNKAVITGTSSIHDWEMELIRFSSGFTVVSEGSEIKDFRNITFNCKASDIRSDNSIMNRKTQDALNADDFPEIRFAGTSVSDLVTEGNNVSGTVTGKLALAGQTRDLELPFSGTIDEGRISINASKELTFSEFGMEPPTAMLGTLKTGDKVNVTFNLVYNRK